MTLIDEIINDSKVMPYVSSLQSYHPETYYHCLRVAELAVKLGVENEYAEKDQRLLGYSGLLHDIGKKCIDKTVLDKPSALNPEERHLITAHTRLGYLLLSTFDSSVRHIIVAHHEFKKNPYPRKGKDRRTRELLPRTSTERRAVKPQISTLAQILAAADVYDALANARAYKPALEKEKIEKIMKQQYAGNQKYVEQVLAIAVR
ncbi:MAG: HD domain-containing protein [Candidatus Aenigmarchaeota archaeon]|nr:HD domain-containing protein [Candidatus Aenigmarchaeota archaeon]